MFPSVARRCSSKYPDAEWKMIPSFVDYLASDNPGNKPEPPNFQKSTETPGRFNAAIRSRNSLRAATFETLT